MSKLMELADAYASLQSEVEYLQDQGTTNQMATVYPDVYRKYEEARTAVVEAVEKLERDAACLDWLDATGKNKVLSLCDRWYTRADYGQPYRKHKNLREAIDAAMEATNGQGN